MMVLIRDTLEETLNGVGVYGVCDILEFDFADYKGTISGFEVQPCGKTLVINVATINKHMYGVAHVTTFELQLTTVQDVLSYANYIVKQITKDIEQAYNDFDTMNLPINGE